jgi:hypothetical protein
MPGISCGETLGITPVFWKDEPEVQSDVLPMVRPSLQL